MQTRHQRNIVNVFVIAVFFVEAFPSTLHAQTTKPKRQSDPTEIGQLKRRVAELEEENAKLREVIQTLPRVTVTSDVPTSRDKKSSSKRARIMFLDKTTLDVEQFQFVYEWYPENQLQYLNPKLETTASKDVHFAEIKRGVTIERAIPVESIHRIDVDWEFDRTWSMTKKLTIRLKNDEPIVILEMAIAFLPPQKGE